MKWLTRLSIVAVFLLGGLSGAMLGAKLERDRFLRLQRTSPTSLTDQALQSISTEVKLKPDQLDRLRSLLASVQPRLAAIENERRGKIIAIMETVRTGTVAFLDADQVRRYEDLHNRMKKHYAPLAAGAAASALAAFWGG